jgi:S-DNA-T family DNA segregation ATPase FtsK/SpoIIIE
MLRAQLTGRVCHRVNDEASAKMAFGDISPEALTSVLSIAPEQPGTAVAADTSGCWCRVRTPHTSLRDAVAACNRHAHLTPDVPALHAFRPVLPALPTPGTPGTPVPVTA